MSKEMNEKRREKDEKIGKKEKTFKKNTTVDCANIFANRRSGFLYLMLSFCSFIFKFTLIRGKDEKQKQQQKKSFYVRLSNIFASVIMKLKRETCNLCVILTKNHNAISEWINGFRKFFAFYLFYHVHFFAGEWIHSERVNERARVCLQIIWSWTNCTAARSMRLIIKSENRGLFLMYVLVVCFFSLFNCIFVQFIEQLHGISRTPYTTLISTATHFNGWCFSYLSIWFFFHIYQSIS